MKKKLLDFNIRELLVRNVEGGVVNVGIGHLARQGERPRCNAQVGREAAASLPSPGGSLSGKGQVYRDDAK